MKFTVVVATAMALVAASIVDAQTTTTAPISACAAANIRPWIAGVNATACGKETGYRPLDYFLPNATNIPLFCPNQNCRNLLPPTLLARPAAGDCTVKAGAIQMFAQVVDVFVTACASIDIVTPAPTTPAPTTPAPTTPAPTTPEPTTPEPTTPAPTTPEVTTPAPTTPEVTTPQVTTPAATTPEVTTGTPQVTTKTPSTKTPCPLPSPTDAATQEPTIRPAC